MSRAAGTAGNFVLLFLVARLFGVASAGFIFSTFSIAFVTAQIFNFGLSRFTLKSAAADDKTLQIIFKSGLWVSALLLGGVVFGYILSLSVPVNRGIVDIWLAGAALGALMLVQMVCADILKVGGKTGLALLLEVSILPWITAIIAVISWGLLTQDAMIPVYCALAAGLVTSALAVILTHPDVSGGLQRPRIVQFWQENRVQLAIFWTSGSLGVLASRLVGLTLPFLDLPHQAGVLAVSVNLVSLGGTVIHAAQAFFAPQFARLAQGPRAALFKSLALSQGVVFCVFLPIAIPVILFPKAVLSLFGAGFTGMDGSLLMTMMLAQVLRSAGGCAELFLAMTGHGIAEALILAASVLAFFGVILLAEPPSIPSVGYAYAAMLGIRGGLAMILAYTLHSPASEKKSFAQ